MTGQDSRTLLCATSDKVPTMRSRQIGFQGRRNKTRHKVRQGRGVSCDVAVKEQDGEREGLARGRARTRGVRAPLLKRR